MAHNFQISKTKCDIHTKNNMKLHSITALLPLLEVVRSDPQTMFSTFIPTTSPSNDNELETVHFDMWGYGIPVKGKCFAVDKVGSTTTYESRCREGGTIYNFYNGASDWGYEHYFPDEQYATVHVQYNVGCPGKENACSVMTSEGACASCVHLESSSFEADCSNLESFDATVGIYCSSYEGCGARDYFGLKETEEMCSHPAIEYFSSTSSPTSSPSNDNDNDNNNSNEPDGDSDTEVADPSTDEKQNLGCFSANSLIDVHGRGTVMMKDLQIGDKIRVDFSKYESVYSFAHYELEREEDFIQVFVDN